MQKEKSVRTYQRKSKNGKVVTVRSYKAKYDAAEEARKEMAKRAGAGDELKKKKSAAPADLGFTADEFKIWANDLDVKEAKRIDKILVKKYGEKAVQKLADEINAGNSRTHKAVFARLSSEGVKKTADKTTSKNTISNTTTKVIKGVKGDEKVDIAYKFSEDSQGRIHRMRQVNGGTWKKCPLLIGEKSIRDFDKATRDLAESQGITFRNGEWVKRVGPSLSGKDVSKQLTEKKSSRKTTKVGKEEYQTGMKVATKTSKESSAKSKVDYNSFAEKKLKKYKSWKVSKQGSGYVLTNPNSDPYRSPETLRVSPSFATSLMEYQKGNKAAIKSYAATLKKEDKKGSAEHEKKTSKTTKTKSSDAMSKSAKETSSKKQVLRGEAKNMGASAIKYNNKTYMVTTDGKVETVTGRKVGKALSDKILDIKASGSSE